MTNYRYIKHAEIDFEKWDDCVNAALNGNIYSLSWYLNIVSPDWDGIADIAEGKYESVMAVPHFRKFGLIKYIAEPPHVNQLGLIHRQEITSESLAKVVDILKSKVNQITNLPLNEANEMELPAGFGDKTSVSRHDSYQLSLSGSYETLLSNFSADRRKNIRKSHQENLSLVVSDNIDDLIQMHKHFTAPKIYGGVSDHQYDLLKKLYLTSGRKGCSEIFAVMSGSNAIGYCMFYYFKNRIIKFCNVSSDEGRTLNADSFLMDRVLRDWAGQDKIFDFERASTPGVNHYKESFGAKAVSYSSVTYSNLPVLIKLVKQIRHSIIVRNKNDTINPEAGAS